VKSKSSSILREWTTAELGAFFVENRAEFLSHAKRVTRSLAEAEEIVQDSLVRVLLACPELENAKHAQAYFHRVIENLSVDIHRREGRQPHLVLLDEASVELESKWRDQADLSEGISAAEDAAILREAIALLSHAERAALVMWEIEGRSMAEIAAELGVKSSVVRHTLTRARAKLRHLLSERVIDESRGTTALDLLSITYRKSQAVIQKSSRTALSIVLVCSAFVGFQSMSPSDLLTADEVSSVNSDLGGEVFPDSSLAEVAKETARESAVKTPSENEADAFAPATAKSLESGSSLDSGMPIFAGLDSNGVPTGFTISDSLGRSGSLFSGRQSSLVTETGLLISNIVSTRSSASNVLIDQSVIVDDFGTSYVAKVLVGVNGGWEPLRLTYISSDMERLISGEYLLTAVLMVDSVVETTVRVSTSPLGSDLESAPAYIATRVLLDPTKSKILAQTVFVSANPQQDGA
jgi:RNA polymerase sigma factor (sigma-70 family)